ncbi:hypothetical protein GCM10027605_26930 [Micromonospora zhanjiangensis]
MLDRSTGKVEVTSHNHGFAVAWPGRDEQPGAVAWPGRDDQPGAAGGARPGSALPTRWCPIG